MELFAAAALRAGVSGQKARKFLSCMTTDEAWEKCSATERLRIMGQIMESLDKHLIYRAGGELLIGAVVYSNIYGILGRTENVERFIGI